jgi:hypothetical protein
MSCGPYSIKGIYLNDITNLKRFPEILKGNYELANRTHALFRQILEISIPYILTDGSLGFIETVRRILDPQKNFYLQTSNMKPDVLSQNLITFVEFRRLRSSVRIQFKKRLDFYLYEGLK